MENSMRLGKHLGRAAIFAVFATSAVQPIFADVKPDNRPAASDGAAPAEKPATPTCPGDDPKGKEVPEPKPERAVTHHRLRIGATTIDYAATAGTLILRNAEDRPVASIGYIAYTQSDVADPGRRPLTFAFNGGPGSSSMWLHMG